MVFAQYSGVSWKMMSRSPRWSTRCQCRLIRADGLVAADAEQCPALQVCRSCGHHATPISPCRPTVRTDAAPSAGADQHDRSLVNLADLSEIASVRLSTPIHTIASDGWSAKATCVRRISTRRLSVDMPDTIVARYMPGTVVQAGSRGARIKPRLGASAAAARNRCCRLRRQEVVAHVCNDPLVIVTEVS